MRHQRARAGFTLTEVLLAVAIMTILAGVIVVAVMHYLRSMTQLERDGIAKELFVAAQNHLTSAESQGYAGYSDYGIRESSGNEPTIYYFVVNKGDAFIKDSTVLDLMLPFGSVDETVRLGGSWIIRYQAEPALVLDVFYTTEDGRFSHRFDESEYETLISKYRGTDQKSARRKYGSDKSVIGWYGGSEATRLLFGEKLQVPSLEVINGDRLLARVKDPNTLVSGASLQVIITGETSGSRKCVTLTSMDILSKNIEYDAFTATYTIILDDITSPGMHFDELFGKDGFIPGENITLQANAYNPYELTNVAMSGVKTVNSLFADIETDDDGEMTALIGSIRHLENLDPLISDLGRNAPVNTPDVTAAVQTTDLSWTDFRNAIGGDSADKVSVYSYDSLSASAEGCYVPVTPEVPLDYDGTRHAISDIRVSVSGDAGVFGTLNGGRAANLLIIDPSVQTSSGNAGALAGSAADAVIENVVAYNSSTYDDSSVEMIPKILAASGTGAAGGLIGKVSSAGETGNGMQVKACAAALYVMHVGSGEAGGLIGKVMAGTSSSVVISDSYAGGHTKDGAYDAGSFNVRSNSGVAGGLIGLTGIAEGSAEGTVDISCCYSTCSVSGTVAGGLAGSAADTDISDSYATGLVSGGTAGAFAGTVRDVKLSDNYYYETINAVAAADGSVTYLSPLGRGASDSGVLPLDQSAASYGAFVGAPSEQAAAKPYDAVLKTYYQGYYQLKSVGQMDTALDETSFVTVHYGDWPAPEIMIQNIPTE